MSQSNPMESGVTNSQSEVDLGQPPFCIEDGMEMESIINPRTHNRYWYCPECGWGYDVKGRY